MSRFSSSLIAAMLLGIVATPAFAAQPDTMIGRTVVNFKLPDYKGTFHSLDDSKSKKLIVVAFLGAECPLANRYAKRLTELAAEFGARGVGFVGVDSNHQDSFEQMARLATEQGISFPLVKDVGNVLADQLGARRTPEVFALDERRVIRYRGRIDDQFGFDYVRAKAGQRHLAVALEELLAGKKVSRPVVEAEGCLIGRVPLTKTAGPVTFSGQISRIFQKHCVTCHRPGSIAPFSLVRHQDAAGWAETIREVVQERRMPPWDADGKFGSFANDVRLSDDEIKLISRWAEDGAPEGNPRDLPPPAHFADGWRIPKPDMIVSMPRPYQVPAGGTVRYQYFVVDPGFREDKWVAAAEAQAGNRAVVHHILVMVLAPDRPKGPLAPPDHLAAGVPGMPPTIFPPGVAKCIPAGSRLVFQVHYTPNGIAQTDQSRIGLVFTDPKTVQREIRAELAVNEKLVIPPNADNFRVTASHRFRQNTLLYSLFPHMHLRGKSFQFEAVFPDGKREILLNVPRYRFNWQNQYVLDRPKLMPEGTVLHCVAHFDNSRNNPSNPDPTATVKWGDQTWEEMMVGYLDTALAYQDLRSGPPRVRAVKKDEYEVTFHYKAPPGTKEVYLAGTFNDWKTNVHKMSGPDGQGVFSTRLQLKRGNHEYKFVLEGRVWRSDPANRRQTGFYNNSLLTVR
jgi:peroxiredoxin